MSTYSPVLHTCLKCRWPFKCAAKGLCPDQVEGCVCQQIHGFTAEGCRVSLYGCNLCYISSLDAAKYMVESDEDIATHDRCMRQQGWAFS